MEFKKGDKVKIIQRKSGNITGSENYGKSNGDVGSIGSITAISSSESTYCVEDGSKYYGWFDKDDLELLTDKFILPEKWCIDRENKPDVIEWFNNNNAASRKDYDGVLLGWMTHFPAYYNNCHTSEWVESGYTEITHEQFKQHFMKKLPKHWYIRVTKENQSTVSKWRLTNATSFLHKENIEVGMFVMSDHHDGSYYYGAHDENELNSDFPSHQSINFKTFLEITGMKTYTITREQFLQGHELACSEWQERLTKKFAVQLIKSDTIEVDDDFVQLLRSSASNNAQREFLDKLFVDPNLIQLKDLEIGEAMRIKDTSSNYNGAVVLRTYDEFVDINNPRNTWGGIPPSFKGVRVKLKIEAEEC